MARILLIDDDPDIRFVARMALKRGKHEVLVAEGGAQALALVDAGEQLDLVICDRMMPEMSGIQMLQELRKRPHGAKMPFVFLTARALAGEVEEGLRLGARRYLTKPFEPSELVAQVNAVLAESDGEAR
jgi:DNA-binding response OmpR family regulator